MLVFNKNHDIDFIMFSFSLKIHQNLYFFLLSRGQQPMLIYFLTIPPPIQINSPKIPQPINKNNSDCYRPLMFNPGITITEIFPSPVACRSSVFTFTSSPPEPLGQFLPNWHKAYFGKTDHCLFK